MNEYKEQAQAILQQWRHMKNNSDYNLQDRIDFLCSTGDWQLGAIEIILDFAISSPAETTSRTAIWSTSKENTDTSGIRNFDQEGEGYSQ